MCIRDSDEDGLDMKNTNWDGDESTGNLPVSGRLVENYIKSIDDKATPCLLYTSKDEIRKMIRDGLKVK